MKFENTLQATIQLSFTKMFFFFWAKHKFDIEKETNKQKQVLTSSHL